METLSPKQTGETPDAAAPRTEDADPRTLRAAAERGDPAAQLELGGRLLVGRDGITAEPAEGMQLVRTALEQGHAEAFNLMATLTAAGAWTEHSWPRALDLLCAAAERGSADARTQLRLIAGDRDLAAAVERGADTGVDVWRRLRASADLERFVQPPQPVPKCNSPRIWTADGFATPGECDWLIERARDKLQPAKMYDRAERVTRFNAIRNNSDYFFNVVESGLLMVLLRVRISLLVSLPVPHMEPPQMLHYAPGQELRAHFDFLRDNNSPYGENNYQGNRVVTFLLYLNEGYEGGHTHFIRADLRHRGRRGDAVFFANLKGGEPDRMSLHSGTAVESGEKWLLSQWIHDRPFTA